MEQVFESRDEEVQTAAAGLDKPLLQQTDNRFTLLPVCDQEAFEFYKKAQASYWTVEEVNLSEDIRDWGTLSPEAKHFISTVLAFFVVSDGIVLENLAFRFMQDVTLPEARAFYSFQSAIETVHNEMYGRLIETFITDSQERSKLFHATQNFPIISEKSQWAMKWIKSDACFAQRLVAFACVEGIFFSGSFCAVFWLRTRGVMPGLCFSNELISRDEGLHTDFACFLYRKLECKLSEHSIHGIVSSAVDLECKFCKEALPTALLGINAASMAEYIRFVADRLLIALGVSRIYRTSNPFPWMEQISLQGKTNFFERRVGEYQRAGVMDTSRKVADRHVFTLTADF